jgi:hypothetical protein
VVTAEGRTTVANRVNASILIDIKEECVLSIGEFQSMRNTMCLASFRMSTVELRLPNDTWHDYLRIGLNRAY